jgi:hypothetical protein
MARGQKAEVVTFYEGRNRKLLGRYLDRRMKDEGISQGAYLEIGEE